MNWAMFWPSRAATSKALALAVALAVSHPTTTQATAIYLGDLEVDVSISSVSSSISGSLQSIPSTLEIVAQTAEAVSAEVRGVAATATIGGGAGVISGGAGVGDGPATLTNLGDGFGIDSRVSGEANEPGDFATSSAARAGAISFFNNSIMDEVFTINVGLVANVELSATADTSASDSFVDFVLAVVENDAARVIEDTVFSPSGALSESFNFLIDFVLGPGEAFGLGVGTGIGGAARVAVPEPPAFILFLAGIVSIACLAMQRAVRV
jgi:hypothetical protein